MQYVAVCVIMSQNKWVLVYREPVVTTHVEIKDILRPRQKIQISLPVVN